MRNTMLTILFAGLVLALHPARAAVQEPALPEAIVPDRIIQLFNGKDLSGWKPDVPAKDKDPNAPESFIVRDGMLVSLGVPRGHLLTEGSYRDYRLEVEYRFPGKPGNCGVLVHASKLAGALVDVPAVDRGADEPPARR